MVPRNRERNAYSPEDRPRNLRSAAILAGSSGNAIFTVTRGRAAKHYNARLRAERAPVHRERSSSHIIAPPEIDHRDPVDLVAASRRVSAWFQG